MMTTLETVAGAIAAGAVSAWGLVKLWAKSIQDTQAKHAAALEYLQSTRCPLESGRITKIETIQDGTAASLDRIEASIAALDSRMTAMTHELGEILGRISHTRIST